MKMNRFLIALFVSISCMALAQNNEPVNSVVPLDNTGRIQYLEVVEQEGVPAELFKRCVKWINTAYVNPTAVTKERNMTDKKIVIKHLFPIYNGSVEQQNKSGHVLYTMTLQFRDNRYRIELTDFLLKQASRFPARRWLDENGVDYNPAYVEQLNSFATELIESLKQAMQPEEEYQEEAW